MPSPDIVEPVLTHSEALRDKIFEHLPPQARAALMGVEVKFWPNEHGEMELDLRYDPTNNVLDIDATEGVYGEDEKITGYLVKGCELDPETGEVHAYTEGMAAEKSTQRPLQPVLVDSERDALRFTQTKEAFLLSLFDKL